VLQQLAWRTGPNDLSSSVETFLKHIGNTLQIASSPGWFIALLFKFRTHSTASAVASASIGWGIWTVVALVALRLRDRLTGGPATIEAAPPMPSRRRFVGQAAMACGAAGLGGTSAITAIANPLDLRVARYTIPIRGLPRSLDGLTIVQLSDVHLGPRVPESMVVHAVELARSLGADVYALTGDYVEHVDGHTQRAGDLLVPLVRAAKIGVVGVRGNHDHYGDGELVNMSLRSAGVIMLNNTRVFVSRDRRLVEYQPEGGLCIAGVDDLMESICDVDGALRGASADTPTLLLSHNPDVAETCVRSSHRVDLMLAGHTHGGQVRLPLLGSIVSLSAYGEKYRIGLVQGPHCLVIISAGVGMTVLPLRVGVPPEIGHITLTAA
jgi:predicted MPP superfamily phosphohydrolase